MCVALCTTQDGLDCGRTCENACFGPLLTPPVWFLIVLPKRFRPLYHVCVRPPMQLDAPNHPVAIIPLLIGLGMILVTSTAATQYLWNHPVVPLHCRRRCGLAAGAVKQVSVVMKELPRTLSRSSRTVGVEDLVIHDEESLVEPSPSRPSRHAYVVTDSALRRAKSTSARARKFEVPESPTRAPLPQRSSHMLELELLSHPRFDPERRRKGGPRRLVPLPVDTPAGVDAGKVHLPRLLRYYKNTKPLPQAPAPQAFVPSTDLPGTHPPSIVACAITRRNVGLHVCVCCCVSPLQKP